MCGLVVGLVRRLLYLGNRGGTVSCPGIFGLDWSLETIPVNLSFCAHAVSLFHQQYYFVEVINMASCHQVSPLIVS